MHDPVGSHPVMGWTTVENEGLLQANDTIVILDNMIVPSGLPVTFVCGPIHSYPVCGIAVNSIKEVPLLGVSFYLGFSWNHKKYRNQVAESKSLFP